MTNPHTRQRIISTGVVFTTRNAPVEGVTEVVDRPAVDSYDNPLPPKFPTLSRVSAPTQADEATTEADEEAHSNDD